MENKRIIIGGGGTGGHIFPAISIANALKEKFPATEILFVGAEGKIEMEKVPAAGYRIIGLPVAGFQRKLSLKNISFFFKLLKSMIKAKRIIREFKPDLAVGVGGYASGPILRAAANHGIPIAIQEQNSYAGVTNRILAKKASRIFVAYTEMEKYFPEEKIILAGNPVRKDIISYNNCGDQAYETFGFNKNLSTILVIGGSLGAGTINQCIRKNIGQFGNEIQLLWQTGKYYFSSISGELSSITGSNIRIVPFISEMNQAFYVADIIISRAGAGTISELALVGKPVILVPSPNVAEDHQTKNAMALSKRGAAVHIRDEEALDKLVPEALALLKDETRKKELSRNISKFAMPGSADEIAGELFKIIC